MVGVVGAVYSTSCCSHTVLAVVLVVPEVAFLEAVVTGWY